MTRAGTLWRTAWCWLVWQAVLGGSPAAAGAALRQPPALERLGEQLLELLRQQAGPQGLGNLLLVVTGDGGSIPATCRLQQDVQQFLLQRLKQSLFVERARAWQAAAGWRGSELVQCRLFGCRWILRLRLSLQEQWLTVAGDLSPARESLWRRLAGDASPRRQPRHLFAKVEADAEVRLGVGLQPAATAPTGWHMREVLRLPVPIIDVGAGPVDDRNGDEVVTLEAGRIRVWRFDEGTLQALASYDFSRLPDSPVRSRREAGRLLIADFNADGRAEVFYHTNNKRQGELLAYTGARLVSWRKLDGVPLCLVRQAGRPQLLLGSYRQGTDRLQGELHLVDINAATGPSITLGHDGYQLQCWSDTEGQRLGWLDSEGVLRVFDMQGRESWQLPGVGKAFTRLPPWSDDGLLVHSLAVRPPAMDQLLAVRRRQAVWRGDEVPLQLLAMTRAGCSDGGRDCLWVVGRDEAGGSRLLLWEPGP